MMRVPAIASDRIFPENFLGVVEVATALVKEGQLASGLPLLIHHLPFKSTTSVGPTTPRLICTLRQLRTGRIVLPTAVSLARKSIRVPELGKRGSFPPRSRQHAAVAWVARGSSEPLTLPVVYKSTPGTRDRSHGKSSWSYADRIRVGIHITPVTAVAQGEPCKSHLVQH
jgi:hypothetical protein